MNTQLLKGKVCAAGEDTQFIRKSMIKGVFIKKGRGILPIKTRKLPLHSLLVQV